MQTGQQQQSETDVIWDSALLEKYNTSGPRYTSYPTALSFHEQVSRNDIISAWQQSDRNELSLYVHLPFCHTLCYYCGCNKVITRHPEKVDRYLDALAAEIAGLPAAFKAKPVSQIHWGGGTPTFLDCRQSERLMAMLSAAFAIQPTAQISIEVDPRELPLERLDTLKRIGFNRLSIGVQDFSETVQLAVNRIQSEQLVANLMKHARDLGFDSINLDLIYGLPHQTVKSFAATLEQVLALDPERLSVFNYAHLPDRFAAQRKIKDEHLPAADQKLAVLRHTIDTLTAAGYQFIGMDHFAKPDDELAVAQRQGVLHRNFQGYTTHPNCDLLGLGVSSISQIGRSFSQNHRELKSYYQAVEQHQHAHTKGYVLSDDDVIRQRVIRDLICNMQLSIADIEQQFDIDFCDYFSDAIARLPELAEDGLITWDGAVITVQPAGKLLIRNICMLFDAYLKQTQQRFSKVI
ncbi:coproporphyrinogen-III oxidase [Neiella marina]|uniref:Coproporphyrinogen-III oxidase n=1 Tax=Neiella marina TaxID=508461 RepID=A0A8J2U1P7_9GAMM|nr:oxygen-independent coproporphyrinogen III oxidase [Neiella marina]GGA63398.1 coproporphyrinogen-III oxidase [Neiella marina]